MWFFLSLFRRTTQRAYDLKCARGRRNGPCNYTHFYKVRPNELSRQICPAAFDSSLRTSAQYIPTRAPVTAAHRASRLKHDPMWRRRANVSHPERMRPEATTLTPPPPLKCAVNFEYDSLPEMWNRFYDLYAKSPNVLILRYEDAMQYPIPAAKLMARAVRCTLSEAKAKKFRDEIHDMDKVSYGKPKDFKTASDFNLNERWRQGLSKQHLQDSCDRLDKDLMTLFDYKC